jgi:type III secretion protein S
MWSRKLTFSEVLKMENGFIPDIAYQGLWIVLIASMPAVIGAAVVGLGIAIIQAATQINDQSIGQAAKLIVIIVIIALTSQWTANQIYIYTNRILTSVGLITPHEN